MREFDNVNQDRGRKGSPFIQLTGHIILLKSQFSSCGSSSLLMPPAPFHQQKNTGLKAQHSENEDHGIWSHHFMGNRWGNSGNSVRLNFSGLQNHYRW